MSIYYYLNGSFLDMIGAKFLTTGSWSMRFVSELSITGFWAGTFRDTLQFAFSGFSKACVFFVIENASIDSRPLYRFDAFSTVRTETCEKNCTLWLKLNTMRMPQTRAPVIFSVIVFILIRFPRGLPQGFSTIYTTMICTRFRFDPL